MMNRVFDGRVLGSDSDEGEDGRDGGRARVASWISARAVTALATTYKVSYTDFIWSAHHRIAISDQVSQSLDEAVLDT
jgi:hypothetical protein